MGSLASSFTSAASAEVFVSVLPALFDLVSNFALGSAIILLSLYLLSGWCGKPSRSFVSEDKNNSLFGLSYYSKVVY